MAGHPVVAGRREDLERLGRQASSTPAALGRPVGQRRAARVEPAPARDPAGVGDLSGEHHGLELSISGTTESSALV